MSATALPASSTIPSSSPTPNPSFRVLDKPCASARLGGIEIVCLTEGVGAFSAEARANAVREVLRSLAENRSTDASRIQTVFKDDGYSFVFDETVLLTLTTREIGGSDPEATNRKVKAVADSMRSAIAADRMLKNSNILLWGISKTVVLSIALITLLFLFSRIWSKIYLFIQQSDGRYFKSLKIQSFELLNSKRIVAFATWVMQTVRVVLTLLAFYVYIPLVFSFFPWTEHWSPKLFGYIVDPFVTIFSILIDYVPNVFFIAVIIIITRYLLKVIKFFFIEIEIGHLKFDGFYREWADPTYKLVRFIVVAFAFVMAFPYLPGSHSPAFRGVSVFLGILLSLGSSSAIGNMVAGVVLTYMRPFKVGDRVKISDTIGDVIEKNLLVTRVRSIKNVDITIPNSMVLGSHMVNYSSAASTEGLILNTTVTIGYDASWKQIHELLIEAAARTKLIDTSLKSFVFQTALNDFYVSYELNTFTRFPNEMAQIYSDLHQNIQDCFNEAGVEIMSPHYAALRDGNEPAMNSPVKQNPKSFRVDSGLSNGGT